MKTKPIAITSNVHIIPVSGMPHTFNSITSRIALRSSKNASIGTCQRCTLRQVMEVSMMRLIDADALMEQVGIAVECKDCPRKLSFGCKEDSSFVYACESITDAPTVIQWIPVTERLPEANNPVLVTTVGKSKCYTGVDWIIPDTDTWSRSVKVVAWMSLPAPYQGR